MFIIDDDIVNVVKIFKRDFENEDRIFRVRNFFVIWLKNSEFYIGFWKFEIRQNGGDFWPHKVKS